MTTDEKSELLREVSRCLRPATEVRKVVVFGSFLSSDSPNDMDVAVFVDGGISYLDIAMKLRRLAEPVARWIPLDIIPVRPDAKGAILDAIAQGTVVYER